MTISNKKAFKYALLSGVIFAVITEVFESFEGSEFSFWLFLLKGICFTSAMFVYFKYKINLSKPPK